MQSFMAGSRLGYGLLAKLANGQRANLDLSKRGADLSRGPQALSKLPAAAWSNTWPAPAATLDLDFANNRGFVRGSGQGGAMDAVTFTRASSGNWVDNTGVLKTGAGTFTGTANALGVNLVPSPQNFDIGWSNTAAGSSTVRTNTLVAPDNTLTANSLIANNSGNASGLAYSNLLAINTTYTLSCYAKKGSANFLKLRNLGVNNNTNSNAWFNLNTGAIGTVQSAVTAAIVDVGNGWYRCSITGATPATVGTNRIDVTVCDNDNSDSVAVGNFIYIWGAQLEVGASATTYYPTNINAPRFDWASTTSSVQATSPYTATTTTTASNNLLLYSQNYTQTSWTKGNTTITSTNNAAPDGTNTATLFTQTNTNSATSVYQSYSASGYNVTVSFHVKRGNTDWLRLDLYTSSTVGYLVWFNTATGQFGSTLLSGGTPINTQATVVALANGWYRVSLTAGLVGSGAIVGAQAVNADNSSTRVNTGTYLMWGTQVETNATNTPLVANSTCNGLLIEESRTNRILWCRDGTFGPARNLLAYSEQFNNAVWTKGAATISADSTTDPNGGTTADTLLETTATAAHIAFQAPSLIIAGTYTFSIYIKDAGRAFASIKLTNTGTTNQWAAADFDLTNVTSVVVNGAGGQFSSTSATITSVGSGWYRCTLTTTSSGTWTNAGVQTSNSATPTHGNFGDVSFAGDATKGIYVWGAQLDFRSSATTYEQTTVSGAIWLRNNTTTAKTATGIDGVANAATTITASSSNGTAIQYISLASGSRTGSVYLKRITGTGNVQVTLDGSTWSTVDLSNGLWNRIVLSGTVTNPCVGVLLATNGDAVAMDYAQVEDGAFVTSPILTTTATATRAVDSATMANINSNSWYTNPYGTMYSEFFLPLNATAGSVVWTLSAQDNTNYADLWRQSATQFRLDVITPADSSFAFGVTTSISNTFVYRCAVKIQQYLIDFVGNSFSPVVGSKKFQPNYRQLVIGAAYNSTSQIGNCIRRIAYVPQALDQDQLKDFVAGNN